MVFYCCNTVIFARYQKQVRNREEETVGPHGVSLSFNGGSKGGHPSSQLASPSRRCINVPFSRRLISQRLPFSSVRIMNFVIIRPPFTQVGGRAFQEAVGSCGENETDFRL